MALVDSDTLHVEGYFEETKLARIHTGDNGAGPSDGRQQVTLTGHVESIAAGIEDRDRAEGSNLLANVNPTFSWVRLAQRVPVRIALDPVPDGCRWSPGVRRRWRYWINAGADGLAFGLGKNRQ